MIVTILDCGVGNLHSIQKAVASHGATARVVDDPAAAAEAEALVLPGVGAFEPAAARLAVARERLRAAILGGLPTLGICLGMQLLFERSEEGDGDGLGIFAGTVTRLAARRLPQLGWNVVHWGSGLPLATDGFREAYFANTFVCRPGAAGDAIAWSTHESDRFPAAVRRGACVGVQFHPEKSSAPGLRFIGSWLDAATRART